MSDHGGNVYEAARERGIDVESIIDFSASINPLGMPKCVRRIIRQAINRLRHYPEPYSSQLEAEVARRIAVDPRSVICGNGSTELIYMIPRILRPEKALIPEPTFREYERACRIVGTKEIVNLGLSRKNSFEIVPEVFQQALSDMMAALQPMHARCSVAFLCNPNNPTGRVVPKNSVTRIAEVAAEEACYLVVDEAFIDYCPQESVSTLIKDNPYLIVLRSMTKFYAIPGIRIGYSLVHPSLSDRFREQKEPWTINALAQAIGAEVLHDKVFEERSLRVMVREKKFLENGFRSLGISFIPSVANYYLIELPDAGQVRKGLAEKGILVRDCSNFAGLDRTYIRVAVRSRGENKLLLEEMAVICRAL
jgi:threonine-phosphate decarboxylase